MDILRDLRRRSLQLDNGDVERFRSSSANERRGSMAGDSLSAADKKGHSSGGLLHRFPFFSNLFVFIGCWSFHWLLCRPYQPLLAYLSSVLLAIYGATIWTSWRWKWKETGAWLNHSWRHFFWESFCAWIITAPFNPWTLTRSVISFFPQCRLSIWPTKCSGVDHGSGLRGNNNKSQARTPSVHDLHRRTL